MSFRTRSTMTALLRRLRGAGEALVSFVGSLPPEVEEALRERRADRMRVELFAQRPFAGEALAALQRNGFVIHPQEPVSPEMMILDRHYYHALDTGEALPRDPALLSHLLSIRARELVVTTGRVGRCDDNAGILVLEELEHLTFDVRCRLPVTRGQWVQVQGSRSLSPFAPTYLPHTIEALEVMPLVRAVTGGGPGHSVLAEELPARVLQRWEAVLRARGLTDLWDAAGYLQQHRIHPQEALHCLAPGASRLVGWALTAAAALALQQGMGGHAAVKAEIQHGLRAMAEAISPEANLPGSLHHHLGLQPKALEAVIDAIALEVVAAVQEQPTPKTGFSARTGA